MSVEIFVNSEENITVVLYLVASKNDPSIVFTDTDKDVLVKDCADEIDPASVEQHQIIFRRPCYADSNRILDSGIKMDEDSFRINPSMMRLERICTLIRSWTFKGADGTPVKTTRENIKKLHPAVANVLGMELENKLRAVNAI